MCIRDRADVDRLEGHSLAAFFYQVIGKMDEKLDKERQEAYAARVKYDAALHDLSSVDADLGQIQNRLARLSDCERQYQAALSEKIKSIKVSAHQMCIRDSLWSMPHATVTGIASTMSMMVTAVRTLTALPFRNFWMISGKERWQQSLPKTSPDLDATTSKPERCLLYTSRCV